MKFHTIVVTKGRQLAARFTYSRGSGPERKAARVYFRRKASGPRGYMCVSHGGSRQRLASGNKLRVVLFTSSRKWIQRRARKSGGNLECRSWKAARAEKKRSSTLPSRRHAPTLLLIFLRATAPSLFFFPFLYPATGIHLLPLVRSNDDSRNLLRNLRI